MNYSLPKSVKDILEKFDKAGFKIYIVGGSVRDLYMKRGVHDWDFTTDAQPEEMLKLFPDGFYDNKFGTVGIPIKTEAVARGGAQEGSRSEARMSDGADERQDPQKFEIYEITTMRKEGDYKDYRHPTEVGWTNKIEEDLARRDFTINAMALTCHPRSNRGSIIDIDSRFCGNDMELVDPFHGQEDIKNKIIRAVGDPNQRFKEDALRLMRVIRIATQLDFEIEKNTFKSIQDDAGLIKEVASERIRDEFFKILASMNRYIGIVKLREAGILQIILPELEKCFGVMQMGPKHDRIYDIGEHSLLTLKTTPSDDPLVLFAALLHDIGKPETAKTDTTGNVSFHNHEVAGGRLALEIAKRFNLSKKQSEKLFHLIRWHQFSVDEKQTDSAIRRFINNVGVENVDDAINLRIGDRLGGGTEKAVSWRMEQFQERIKQVLTKPFSISDLKINGDDVMKTLNIPPGKKVGEILQKLFEEVLEDSEKNNKDYLLQRIISLKN